MVKKKIVFATNNQHKLDEVRKMVGDRFEIIGLSEIGCNDDIPETAETLEGNAILKAQYVKEKYNYNCFADDTGLEVKALNNDPGVYSARYAGEAKDSKANMCKVLANMEGIQDREARFRTVIALSIDDKMYTFEGIVNGFITEKESGESGFGYDPIFRPEGYDQTFAEMTGNQKNEISHRAEAVRKFMEFIYTL